jgi:hypothetical protein
VTSNAFQEGIAWEPPQRDPPCNEDETSSPREITLQSDS